MRSADARLALVLLAAAAPAAAQTSAPPAAPPLGHLDASRIVESSQTFKMVMVSQGAEKDLGQVVNAVIFADVLGSPSIVWLQSVTDPRGSMLDSSVADRATLGPRTHRTTSDAREMRIEFSPGKVFGHFVARGDPPYEVNEKVSEGIFDSSMLDILIAALPLAEGYKARLPVFLWEAGGEITADVVVTGSEMFGTEDTWTVIVTLKDRPAHYNVTKRDPKVVKIMSAPAPGVEIRFVRTWP